MNILITGGAGFIGKTLANRLTEYSINTTTIDIQNNDAFSIH